jgi:hypothetical protein
MLEELPIGFYCVRVVFAKSGGWQMVDSQLGRYLGTAIGCLRRMAAKGKDRNTWNTATPRLHVYHTADN